MVLKICVYFLIDLTIFLRLSVHVAVYNGNFRKKEESFFPPFELKAIVGRSNPHEHTMPSLHKRTKQNNTQLCSGLGKGVSWEIM